MEAGHFRGGMPYNRFGDGARIIVIIQGLMFRNEPLAGVPAFFMIRMYRFLGKVYTVYIVNRRPGMPDGHSMGDMAKDYAEMIAEEFHGPVDVIGVSTGGSIAQHLAADHPEVVRKLVIHSSAHTLNGEAKRAQMRIGRLAREGRWREAYAAMFGLGSSKEGVKGLMTRAFIRIISALGAALDAPDDPSDLVVTVEAEDEHEFKDRLGEITAPTMVVGGDRDPFYSEALFRETAEGIRDAELVIYRGKGHPVSGKRFAEDIMDFLEGEGGIRRK